MLENEVTLGTQLSSGLEIIGLSKLFKKREVVKDISFSMKQGEVIGLLGPNGAGKTTCFYMICGLIKSDRGKIFLHGNDITNMVMYQRSRQGIGYLPQEMSIFRGLTVAQNINASLEVSYRDKGERKKNLDRLLEEFSLSHLANSNALSLSGGERRRVEIARALASNPDFILLDEPFAGVDPIAIDGIRELVRNLVQRGIGVLITDHNVRETLDIIDFGHIMYDGTILISGTPEEILENDAAQQVYLGKGFNR